MENGAEGADEVESSTHQASKDFAVIEFNEETMVDTELQNNSSIVPSTWLLNQGKLCLWPEHLKGLNLYNCILKKKKPELQTWKLYSVKKILGYRSTHKKAAELMNDSEKSDSSDASQGELSRKRKGLPSVRLQNGAESDDVDSAINIEHPPNKLRGVVSLTSVSRGKMTAQDTRKGDSTADPCDNQKNNKTPSGRKNLNFSQQSSSQQVKSRQPLIPLNAHQIGTQILETDTELSAAESPIVQKTSTPKYPRRNAIQPLEDVELSDGDDEDDDDDRDVDFIPDDNNEDEEEDAENDDDEENDKPEDDIGEDQVIAHSDDENGDQTEKKTTEQREATPSDSEDDDMPLQNKRQRLQNSVSSSVIAGMQISMLEQFMKDTIPTVDEIMAKTPDERERIKLTLSIATKKQLSKIYSISVNLLTHAQGTSFVADKEHVLQNQPSKDMYKKWMEKLPLKNLADLEEFEQLLKTNDEVREALAESYRFIKNAETLRALINALMPHLLENVVTLQMNLTGQHGKFAIKQSFFMALIKTTVRKIEPWTKASDNDIILRSPSTGLKMGATG